MFQFQNYPLNDLWAGRKYIVDMWAKPLGLASKGRKLAWDGKRRGRQTKKRGRASERASERGGKRVRGGGRERKRTRMVAAGRQMTVDRRKTHPNCSTVSLSRLFLRVCPLPTLAYNSSRGVLVLASERPISKIFGEAATRAELF